MSTGTNGGQNLIARLKEITITGICATLVINDQLTIGAMMTVGYIVGRLSSPFRSLISTIGSVQDAAISYERLDEAPTKTLNGTDQPSIPHRSSSSATLASNIPDRPRPSLLTASRSK